MEYLDFELEVGPGTGRDYPIEVMRSPAGERTATMHFPFDELELENRLLRVQNALLATGSDTRRRMASPQDTATREFGSALFASLMSGDIRSCFDLSRHEASLQGKGLRIKLRMKAPELAALPWEFLYDPTNAEYLALSRYTPIVRYMDLPRSAPPLPVSPPLRILGMVVSPDDAAPLNVAREKERMERALKGLRERGMVDLTWLEGGTWHDLQRAMRGGPWHVFHFVGHGRFDTNLDEGSILLAGEHGGSDDLTASQLGRLLADHPSLRLVLLNACEGARSGSKDIFSGTASILVQKGIPAVLAMQYEITDRAAIEFARSFYEAISDGLPLDASVGEARKAISLSRDDTVEWGTPVLYMRSPDGVLFKLDSASATPKTEAVASSQPEVDPLDQRRSLEAQWRADWEAQQRAATDAAERAAASTVPPMPAEHAPAPAEPTRSTPAAPEMSTASVTPPPPTAASPVVPPDPQPGPVWTAPPPPTPATPSERTWKAEQPAGPSWPTQPAGPNWPTRPSPRPSAPTGPDWPGQPAGTQPAVTPQPVPSPNPTAVPGWPTAHPEPVPTGPEFVAQGIDGQLTVTQNTVGVRRRGSWAARLRKGDKTVLLTSVTAVHLHAAGPQTGGFVQVCHEGGDQRPVTGWGAGNHEDVVMFNQQQEPAFVRAREIIQELGGKV